MPNDDLVWAIDVANELALQFPERRLSALKAGGCERLGAEHMLLFYLQRNPTGTKVIGVEGDAYGARGAVDTATFARMARTLAEV